MPLAFMLFHCSWVVATYRSTRCPENFEGFFVTDGLLLEY